MQMVEVLHRFGNGVTVGKVIMKRLGIDCGPCRLPLRGFSPRQEHQIIQELEGGRISGQPWSKPVIDHKSPLAALLLFPGAESLKRVFPVL